MVLENDYDDKFQLARSAYLEEDLEQAADIIDEMTQQYPDDPSVLLLKGHIHSKHQEYDLATTQYQKVLNLTEQEDLTKLAVEALKQIENVVPNYSEEINENNDSDNDYDSELFSLDEIEEPDFQDDIEELEDEESNDGWTESIQFENIEWDAEDLEEEELEDPTLQQNTPLSNNYDRQPSSAQIETEDAEENDTAVNILPITATNDEQLQINEDEAIDDIFVELDPTDFNYDQINNQPDDFSTDDIEDNSAPTFVVSSEEPELRDLEEILGADNNNRFSDLDDDPADYSSELRPLDYNTDNFTQESDPVYQNQQNQDQENDQPLVLDGEDDFFFAPDELDDIPDIDAEELPVSSIFTKDSQEKKNFSNGNLEQTNKTLSEQENVFDNDFDNEITGSFTFDTQKINLDLDEDISSSSSFSQISGLGTGLQINPEVDINQGKLANYFNLSLFNKQLVNGGITAIVTFLVVLIVSLFQNANNNTVVEEVTTETEAVEEVVPTTDYSSLGENLILALLASLASGGTVLALGLLMNRHIKRYINELRNQFESIYQGNYEVKVNIYSQDELGTLGAGFNQMAKMINTTTTEARKRAEETERAREDLQRQVIRLLDDVEGAARGDLTVQAEVTADVLGAVADAFNLTITNLRKIVKQVQQAAIQVNKASADSEVFARNQSSDALRMAEELAVTLNSVQMMTDSIQRVAENAQEAEEVARSSSVTALKGGDAVERTVSGILQIRETVSETTRKVKRLAEASQQISTIVAVISQISSRTNLLALNASIQAARAGDAGRGFAIVADEVRQLADRSAKSLQEIEQIVLQIQTETGSVMTAMEEGIQQVRDVTERSEQAKRSLEDIIQVSNRIDALVRSITADTDEQRENSRGVAKVMQAVELTAQATSQESQRVAGSLQNLVGIGKDLISSVERFKVDDH